MTAPHPLARSAGSSVRVVRKAATKLTANNQSSRPSSVCSSDLSRPTPALLTRTSQRRSNLSINSTRSRSSAARSPRSTTIRQELCLGELFA